MIRAAVIFFSTLSVLISGISAQENSAQELTETGVTYNGDSQQRKFNPAIVGGASLLIPGSGQLYTGRYIKAGTFVALEGIALSVSYFWNEEYRLRNALHKNTMDTLNLRRSELQDNSATGDTARLRADVASLASKSALWDFNTREARVRSVNSFAWAAGGYVFNFLDALQSSNHFNSTAEKDPAVAGWLAVVPGLGLGQLYNGSLSKAGFVIMGQSAMAVAAFNYHQLMVKAEKSFEDLNDPNGEQYRLKNQFSDDWEYRQRNAFRSRNMYLWYSLFFYGYSILDAVVDAHLNDYNDKIKIEPDLKPGLDGISANVTVTF